MACSADTMLCIQIGKPSLHNLSTPKVSASLAYLWAALFAARWVWITLNS